METLTGEKRARPLANRPMVDHAETQRNAHGHPLTVAAVVGSFSVAVGLLVRASGLLQGAESGLLAGYQAGGFPLASGTQPWWLILALLGLTYGLALVVLEVPGTPRRLLLAGTVLVLLAAASPVVALWGVFWSPLEALLCSGSSAFCATLWARLYPMPCEQLEMPGEGKVIPMVEEQERRIG